MRIHCLWITLFLPLLLGPSICRAELTELQPLLNELKVAAAQTETVTSRFVQEKYLSIFAEKLISQGNFAYQKPDHLRWELLTPVASGFVLRGTQGERWNSLSQERGHFSIESDPIMGVIAQQLLAWAKVDVDWLQNRYAMELVSTEPVCLRLNPLDAGEASFIDYLDIVFAENRRHISKVLMVEQGGDRTLLRFTEVQLNQELSGEAFRPPEF